MRLRIIAYGVSVLMVLLTVSVLTFQAMRPRAFHLPNFAFFERVLASPDDATRQHLVDEVLDDHKVALSIYTPDGELLVSNVEPPLDVEAHEPPLDGDVSEPLVALGNPGEPPRALPGPPPGLPAPGRARAIEPRLTSSMPFASGGEQRPPLPMMLTVAGAKVIISPLPPDTALGSFAAPLIVTLVGLVLLSFPVTAAMTRKLDALAETARRFGEGELHQRAETSRGSDELNRTAKAFNIMAERIAELRQRERVLLANVSHELRTPMARMAVLLELSQTNPAEAARYQRELSRDLRELEALLERITETFRLELGSPQTRERQLARRVQADLRDIAMGAAKEFRAGAIERVLTLELPTEPVMCEVDEMLVRRAIVNLLDNAGKYSQGPSPILLAVERSGTIVVSDQGDGIAADDLPHVFEPFFRADRSRNRTTGGVGLGLGFVRMVADLHDGDVSVASNPGAGCTFRVALVRVV